MLRYIGFVKQCRSCASRLLKRLCVSVQMIAGIAGGEVRLMLHVTPQPAYHRQTCHALPNLSLLTMTLAAPAVQIDKLCETKGMDYIDRRKAK